MRTDDLRGGSGKALLILLLVAGNIVAAFPRENAKARPNPAPNRSRTTERVLPENHPR
ncbi:MAG: hypothetical protein ABIU29_10740 [Chthoniobacterales bacterium]